MKYLSPYNVQRWTRKSQDKPSIKAISKKMRWVGVLLFLPMCTNKCVFAGF